MVLQFSSGYAQHADEIVALFRSAFAASEGADEGRLIATLVTNFFATTAEDDLFVFTAWSGSELAGCFVFSRLTFDRDDRTVFVLGPVAVATQHQRQGIGQKLLNYGLADIANRGVDIAVTYGDPAYYSKVGFSPVTRQQVPPPMALQYPHGWLAQSLDGGEFRPLQGSSRCVDALNSPEYW